MLDLSGGRKMINGETVWVVYDFNIKEAIFGWKSKENSDCLFWVNGKLDRIEPNRLFVKHRSAQRYAIAIAKEKIRLKIVDAMKLAAAIPHQGFQEIQVGGELRGWERFVIHLDESLKILDKELL